MNIIRRRDGSENRRQKRLISWAVVAGLMAALAGSLVALPTADACDACNAAFETELQNERAGSLLAEHYERTKENHARFDVLQNAFDQQDNGGDEAVGQQVEQAQQQIYAQAGNRPDDPVGAVMPSGDRGERPAVNPNPNNRDFDDVFEDDEFIEIIERDYELEQTPPTSYVPQDVEPDQEVEIDLHEGMTYLGQSVMYDGFLTTGKLPGPTFRVDQGDIVKFTVHNEGTVPHGASIHAAYTQTSKYVGKINPGESKSVTFRATHPGVFMYHCAPGGHAIPMHVMAGQYGMMVVEPQQDYKLEEELGHGPDLELYIAQNEYYSSGKDAVESNPAYAAFNGQPFRYVEEPIGVEPGDYVRIYYLNVGPNLLSTFHFVGLLWDYVYWQGHPEARLPGGQTVTAGPSDSWVIEVRIPPDEGVYTMLTHVVGYATRGAIGLLAAEEGVDGPDVVLAEGPEFTPEEIDEKAEEANRIIAPFAPSSEDLEFPEKYGADVEEVVIDIKGNSYDPAVVEIEEGTKVTWRNKEVFGYMDGEFSGIHNAVGISGPEEFMTDMLGHYEKDSVVFDTPGEYEYICTPHPYMKGKIIVRESEDNAQGCSAAGGPAVPVAVVVMVLAGLAWIRRGSPASVTPQKVSR